MSRSPLLSEVIANHVRMVLESARTSLPGRVESYDPSTQTADVKPMVRDVLVDADGNRLVESLPVVPNVPVAWPRGGGFFLTMPVQKGDFVLLVACDRCIDQWRAKGAEADPGDLRHHDLSDAVAIPGLYPDTQAISEASGTELVLGKDSGLQLRIGDLITLATSGGQTDFVALAQKVFDEIDSLRSTVDTLITVYNSHTHTFTGATSSTCTAGGAVGTCSGTASATSSTASPPAPVQSVAASKVKAE